MACKLERLSALSLDIVNQSSGAEMRFYKHILIAAAAAVTLGACGEPEATDEDIKLLIGDSIDAKHVEECPRLVSGLDKDIYKDLPQEMFGMISTECRKMFKAWLDDPARNPKKLTLSVLENKKFAERLTVLYNTNREEKRKKAEAAAKAAREQQEKERLQKVEEKRVTLQALIDEGNRFLANFETTKTEIAASCDEWSALDTKLKAAGDRAVRFQPSICGKILQDIKLNLETELKNISLILAKDPNEVTWFSKSTLFSLSTLNDYRNRLTNDIAKLKSAVPR